MESFELYMDEFISNAERVTYEKASTYAEIRKANDCFLREEELAGIISDGFPDRVSDIASHLECENARVRRSVAYLLLGKMDSSDEIVKRAITVLEDYANIAKGDETLMARGFLLAYAKRHRTETGVTEDISLLGSLRKKYTAN